MTFRFHGKHVPCTSVTGGVYRAHWGGSAVTPAPSFILCGLFECLFGTGAVAEEEAPTSRVPDNCPLPLRTGFSELCPKQELRSPPLAGSEKPVEPCVERRGQVTHLQGQRAESELCAWSVGPASAGFTRVQHTLGRSSTVLFVVARRTAATAPPQRAWCAPVPHHRSCPLSCRWASPQCCT